jgi:hypothetical protein
MLNDPEKIENEEQLEELLSIPSNETVEMIRRIERRFYISWCGRQNRKIAGHDGKKSL